MKYDSMGIIDFNLKGNKNMKCSIMQKRSISCNQKGILTLKANVQIHEQILHIKSKVYNMKEHYSNIPITNFEQYNYISSL